MSLRLLLIEDSPTQLITIAKTLEAEGYTVIEAKSGAEGLARAYHELPDLIISDVVMTGINGYQLCRLVKNDPDLCATPVILLTKLDGSLDRFWGFKSGADRYIPKEPGFTSLIKATRELLAEAVLKPRLRVIGEPTKSLSVEDVNNRLNQLLERLLFEATIVDEVRKIAEDALDIDNVTERLFELMSSILDYQALGLVLNQGTHSVIRLDASNNQRSGDPNKQGLKGYVARIASQLGLPPFREEIARGHYMPENSLTQPIDITGQRLGVMIVVPNPQQIFKPGDQKVVRLIGEQLSVVLRLMELNVQTNQYR